MSFNMPRPFKVPVIDHKWLLLVVWYKKGLFGKNKIMGGVDTLPRSGVRPKLSLLSERKLVQMIRNNPGMHRPAVKGTLLEHWLHSRELYIITMVWEAAVFSTTWGKKSLKEEKSMVIWDNDFIAWPQWPEEQRNTACIKELLSMMVVALCSGAFFRQWNCGWHNKDPWHQSVLWNC